MNRQRPIAVVVFIFCFALGMPYYLTTPASFTAGGSIIIDKRKLQLFQKESILGEPDIDAATVQTEVEVLKSDNIDLAVVRKLHLADDQEFTGSSKGPVGHFMALLEMRPKAQIQYASLKATRRHRAPFMTTFSGGAYR